MNKFSKIVSMSILLSGALYAASNEQNIVDFEKKKNFTKSKCSSKRYKNRNKKRVTIRLVGVDIF